MATIATDLNIHRAESDVSSKEALKPAASFILVLTAAVLPYIPTLRYGFVYDDTIQILNTPIIRSWSFVPTYFVKPIPVFITRYYRPAFFLWLRVNYFLWHTHSWGWHLTSIVLHAVASILVLLLLRGFFSDRRCALAGALIFAVHPAHVESVAWISGCSDSLMAVGVFGALLLWMRNREGSSLPLRIGSLACCAFALLIKETAVIVPLLIWALPFAQSPPASGGGDHFRNSLTAGIRQAAPYAGLTVLFLSVRHLVLRGVPALANPMPVTEAVVTIPAVLLFYVRHLIWPAALSICYDFGLANRVSDRSFWGPAAALAGIVLVLWIWFKRRRDARIIFATSLVVVPIIPVSYIRFFGSDDFVHDRYLYLSVAGLALFAGLLFEWLLPHLRARGRAWLLAVLASALTVSLALATVVQARPWRSDVALYTNAVQIAPNNSMARNGVASEYITEGRYDQAAETLRKLVRDRPEVWVGNYNYGYFNYVVGNYVLADEYLHRAIQVDPSKPHQYIVLGETYLKEGRFQDAIDQLRQGIARAPDGMGYHLVLALALIKEDSLAAARQETLMELKYHPDNSVARGVLQQLDKQIAVQTGAAH